MDDLFGLENFAALKVALQDRRASRWCERKSYPLGVKDLSPVLRAIKDMNPDAFIGFTYPPDTILASTQAKEVGFNPKFFYASVGTAFQLYKNVMARRRRGRAGHGLVERQDQPRRPRPTSTRTRKKFGEGAGPLGQRPCLGRARRSCSRRWTRSGWTARRCATTSPERVQDHPRRRSRFAGSENAAHPRHRGPVAERRVRGGVAAAIAPPRKLIAAKPAWK